LAVQAFRIRPTAKFLCKFEQLSASSLHSRTGLLSMYDKFTTVIFY
jgi:hypothetical protein